MTKQAEARLIAISKLIAKLEELEIQASSASVNDLLKGDAELIVFLRNEALVMLKELAKENLELVDLVDQEFG